MKTKRKAGNSKQVTGCLPVESTLDRDVGTDPIENITPKRQTKRNKDKQKLASTVQSMKTEGNPKDGQATHSVDAKRPVADLAVLCEELKRQSLTARPKMAISDSKWSAAELSLSFARLADKELPADDVIQNHCEYSESLAARPKLTARPKKAIADSKWSAAELALSFARLADKELPAEEVIQKGCEHSGSLAARPKKAIDDSKWSAAELALSPKLADKELPVDDVQNDPSRPTKHVSISEQSPEAHQVSTDDKAESAPTVDGGSNLQDIPIILQARTGPTYQVPKMIDNVEIQAVVDTAAQVTTNRVCTEEVYVAPIQDEMLLDLNLLRKTDGRINLQLGTIQIGDVSVKMEVPGQNSVTCASIVVVVRRTAVPPHSAVFISWKATARSSDQLLFQPLADLSILNYLKHGTRPPEAELFAESMTPNWPRQSATLCVQIVVLKQSVDTPALADF